jgi:hypothetical protein
MHGEAAGIAFKAPTQTLTQPSFSLGYLLENAVCPDI